MAKRNLGLQLGGDTGGGGGGGELNAAIEEAVEKGQTWISLGGSVHTEKAVITASGTAGKKDTTSQFLTLRAEDLEILQLLGQGSSGQVREARHTPTGKVVALKEIKLTNRHLNEIGNEMSTLYRDKEDGFSPYVIDFYGAYLKEGSVYLALEYMDGSLGDVINKNGVDMASRGVPENILAKMTNMVLLGLDFLHSQKVVHRDLKPSNLLFNSDGVIKITDFGVSHALESDRGDAVSFVGTLTYMSPERLDGTPYKIAADIWGLGVSLVELVSGDHPFHGILRQEDYEGAEVQTRFWKLHSHFNSSAAPLNVPAEASENCKDFLQKCLEKEPNLRCSAADLLKHPWITENCSDIEVDKAHIADWIAKRKAEKKDADAGMSEAELFSCLDSIVKST